MEIILAFLGGGASAALITVIGNFLLHSKQRKEAISDAKVDKLDAIASGVRLLLQDKIKEKCLDAIRDGYIDYPTREFIGKAHDVYHNGLDGNGDLDDVMGQTRELPIKGE